MRGSITRLNKKIGCGFILGEDGCEAYFDVSSLEGIDIRGLSIGGCGISGTLWARAVAGCQGQGHIEPSKQIRKWELNSFCIRGSHLLGTESSFCLAQAEDWLSGPVGIPCTK